MNYIYIIKVCDLLFLMTLCLFSLFHMPSTSAVLLLCLATIHKSRVWAEDCHWLSMTATIFLDHVTNKKWLNPCFVKLLLWRHKRKCMCRYLHCYHSGELELTCSSANTTPTLLCPITQVTGMTKLDENNSGQLLGDVITVCYDRVFRCSVHLHMCSLCQFWPQITSPLSLPISMSPVTWTA